MIIINGEELRRKVFEVVVSGSDISGSVGFNFAKGTIESYEIAIWHIIFSCFPGIIRPHPTPSHGSRKNELYLYYDLSVQWEARQGCQSIYS